MNRIAIFAHYDENNTIQDYVVYCLEELKKAVNRIVFVSDCNIETSELIKIQPYVIETIIGHHGEYDFGSYKKGYKYLLNNNLLNDIDELIFMNDSCYAPLFSFDNMFNVMSKKNLDFWGVTENKCIVNNISHVQSYFIVLKKHLLFSERFYNFINSIKKENSKNDIIQKYEIGLSDTLVKAGYKYDVYSDFSKQVTDVHIFGYDYLIKKEKVPFLKRSLTLRTSQELTFNLKYLIKKYTKYNYNLIVKDIKNNRKTLNINLFLKFIYKLIFRVPKRAIYNFLIYYKLSQKIKKYLNPFNIVQYFKTKNLGESISQNVYNIYKCFNDKQRIKDYLDYKQTHKAKGVVYTCTTNDYDDINEIKIYKYIDKDWDYVFFTDNEEHIKLGQIGIWEVRPLQFKELDNTRNNRWHKLNPHLLFPNYEQSIYIDGNIVILTDYLFKQIDKKKLNFIIPRHFKNNCIYQEYNDVLNANLDSDEIINKELELIKNDNMPRNYGLGENNILYRKHNKKEIIEIDKDWWNMVKSYSKRDQLSLCYILWKHNFNIKQMNINNSRLDHKNFFVMTHKKGGK